MNFEQVQRFNEAKSLEEQKMDEVLQARKEASKQRIREWLEEYQIFKDLLPDENKIEQYKRCKDFLILKRIATMVGRDIYNSADWAKGYMDGINSFLSIINEYNHKREQYTI